MGFFKKLFKKKRGGTFFGNLIRGAANKYSGGLLGNGASLAAWEAKQDKKDFERQVANSIKGKPRAIPPTATSKKTDIDIILGGGDTKPKEEEIMGMPKNTFFLVAGVGALAILLMKKK